MLQTAAHIPHMDGCPQRIGTETEAGAHQIQLTASN